MVSRSNYAIYRKKNRIILKRTRGSTQKFKLKKLRSRWGSTTIDGAVHLSIDLLKAPNDIINYMILHELCHLRIKGHSHRFWDLIHKFMPNYQDKIDWLKVNGSSLAS